MWVAMLGVLRATSLIILCNCLKTVHTFWTRGEANFQQLSGPYSQFRVSVYVSVCVCMSVCVSVCMVCVCACLSVCVV